jgi:Zn-dependent protease with chaperone function
MRTIYATVVALLVLMPAASASEKVELDGYAEWRADSGQDGPYLIVDGQRVITTPGMRFKGEGAARDFGSIPLGYEVKVEGSRVKGGAIAARKIEAKPNGTAMFEKELEQAFDDTEATWRQRGYAFDQGSRGQIQRIGALRESGPEVERVRRITDRLVPPDRDPGEFRVYVVENDAWNAMAAPNGSIYVFSGLLNDMDDDEVAIVLGHELVHATHEHARKQYKRSTWTSLLTMAGVVAAESQLGGGWQTDLLESGAGLTMLAMGNRYSRSHEDQADRVGLRYAYEGGFDVSKAPELWKRFEKKYGATPELYNAIFGDHSTAAARARNLRREIFFNYR